MPEISHKSDRAAVLALIAATFFWSGNFIAGRALGGTVPPLELNLIRWALCLLFLLPTTLGPAWRHRAALRSAWRLILALGVTGIAGFHSMVYQALTLTPAINALLILSLAPVVTAVAGTIWNGFRPSPAQVTGLLFSACGGAVILLSGSGGAHAFSYDRGTLWMLAAIVVWTAYSLLLRRRPAALPQDVTLVASVIAGLCFLAPLTLLSGISVPILNAGQAMAILYIAVFASLLGFLLWSRGVAQIGPERAGQFLHLMPVFGTLLAILLLGESFRLAHGVGAALAVAGIILVSHAENLRSPCSQCREPGDQACRKSW